MVKVIKYEIINKIMEILGLPENIAEIIYQYYLTFERRQNLMIPMKTYPLKYHLKLFYKHRKLDYQNELSINSYMLEGVDRRGDADYKSMYHNETGFDYNLLYYLKKDYKPTKTILQLQKSYNIDYEKREHYCLACMCELDEQEENRCENPRCFFGEGQFGKLCDDCINYDEHSFSDDAMNYNRNDLRVSHCGQSKCEDYLEDKIELIEDGLVCCRCEFVLPPECFEDYPFDNDEGLIYRKRCDDCYENLQDDCERYWEMLREGVFIEKVHKRIKDFWRNYIPDDEDIVY